MLLFQSHSMASLLQLGETNFTVRNVNEHRFRVNAFGKHPVQKRTHFRGRFCFHIINMAQNNKSNGE